MSPRTALPTVDEALQMAQAGVIHLQGYTSADFQALVIAMTERQQFDFINAINSVDQNLAKAVLEADTRYWADHPDEDFPGSRNTFLEELVEEIALEMFRQAQG